MNRRKFLQVAGAAIAAASFPEIAVDAGQVAQSPRADTELRFGKLDTVRFIEIGENHWSEFDAAHDYGNGLTLTARPPPAARKKFVAALYDDMVKWIPPPYQDRVEIYGPVEVDYGHALQISWRYRPHRPPNYRKVVA